MTLPFRAIISDLDGTLLNSEHRLGNFTVQTLEKLAKLGVDIFLATGRNYPDVKQIISKVNIDDAMLVTSNGARANNLAGKLLIQHHIPETLALALMQTPFDDTRVCLNTYQGDHWFINKDIHQLKKYHQDSGFCYELADFSVQHGKEMEKIFFIAKEAADLVSIEQHIKANFGEKLHSTYSTVQCFEVMQKGVCKANTLAELVKLRGYTLADCIAFGDGMNDVEMLEQAGCGCIMGNADARLKAALPNNPIIGENRDEAVAKHISQLFDLN